MFDNSLKVTGIYKIGFKNTDKVYIGSSNNVYQRAKQHLAMLTNDCHHSYKLQNYYNSYSELMFIELIEEVCEEDKFEREFFYIEQYNSITEGFNVSELFPTEVTRPLPSIPKEITLRIFDDLSISEAYLLACMKHWIVVEGIKYLPMPKMEKHLKISVPSMKMFIKKLKKLGYIGINKGKHVTKHNINYYSILK